MPTIHKPFTNVLLEDYQSTGINKASTSHFKSWESSVDLAYQVAEATPLTLPQSRLLVDAARNGLPVVMEWREHGSFSTYRTTVIVESLHTWGRDDRSARVRVSYWGFAHDVYLDKIVAAEVPGSQYT